MKGEPGSKTDSTRLRNLLQEPVSELGLTLLGLSWATGRRGATLRVTVDRPGGVTVDECGAASLAISQMLDLHEAELPESYSLEVSSPGAERMLATEDELRASLGRRLRVVVARSGQEAVIEGRLTAVSDRLLELEARRRSGRLQRIELERSDLVSAQVVVDL
jgi:ribosome maturation factor RimP